MRFTIRDVLWLMGVVGLTIGWGLDRARLVPSRNEAVRDAQRLVELIRPDAGYSYERHEVRDLQRKYSKNSK
jgi:hypothetical protein